MSLISNNASLSDTQKLYYLHFSLRADAKHIDTSDDTYASLFQALKEKGKQKVDMHRGKY